MIQRISQQFKKIVPHEEFFFFFCIKNNALEYQFFLLSRF